MFVEGFEQEFAISTTLWSNELCSFLPQIKVDERLLRTDQGLLIRSLSQSDTGVYHCQAVEHGFIQPLLRLHLQVIPAQKLGDILPGTSPAGGGVGHSPKHRLWYRDFLSLLDHPDLHSVEEFCDRVWKKDRKPRKGKPAVGGAGAGKQAGSSGAPPRASNPQKQQSGPLQGKLWLQSGSPVADGQGRGQNGQKAPQNPALLNSQAAKSSPKTQGGPKAAAVVGGVRGGSQHAAKWRRLQENKKGRNRRTHELQRPPRSV